MLAKLHSHLAPKYSFIAEMSHKYQRYQEIDIDQILKVEYDERVANITQIVDSEVGAKEYKAIFTDGSIDLITITPTRK